MIKIKKSSKNIHSASDLNTKFSILYNNIYEAPQFITRLNQVRYVALDIREYTKVIELLKQHNIPLPLYFDQNNEDF